MRAQMMFAGIALLASTGLAAEPVQSPAREVSQPEADRPVQVVLASAENVRAPDVEAEQRDAAPPKPRRAARVTSCRCGDPQQN
jgi:hypothetical protein